jgi:hypothetical protein
MMANLLGTAATWLEGKRKAFATIDVTYRRGEDSITVKATVGRTTFEQDNADGIILRNESRDYLITAADLLLDGETVLPAIGDRIEETSGETTFIYEVLPIGSQQCWRYSDDYRLTLRIHTKLLSRETGS